MRVPIIQRINPFILLRSYSLLTLKIGFFFPLVTIFLFTGAAFKVYGQQNRKITKDSLTYRSRPNLFGPTDSNNQLASDKANKTPTIKKDFIDQFVEAKEAFYLKTGFKIGADYISIFLKSSESLGEKKRQVVFFVYLEDGICMAKVKLILAGSYTKLNIDMATTVYHHQI